MGEIYPLRIHDTYAVDLTLRYRQLLEIPQLCQLNPSDFIKASLGQTLLPEGVTNKLKACLIKRCTPLTYEKISAY
jgi:hypothetical protein